MLLPDYTCVLYNCGQEESLTHLLLQCPLAIQCWGMINVTIHQTYDPLQTLESFKDQLNVPFFMEAIILMAWAILSIRNDQIFRGIVPTLHAARFNFRNEWRLLLLRAKKSYFPLIEQWIASLL